MTFRKKLFFFLCLGCVFLSGYPGYPSGHGFVLALEVQYPTILGHSLNSTSSLGDFICYFFGLGMDLAFFIAVIVVAFGGVYYLISYGRGKFTSEGKEWVKAGISGLLIVVCSALITQTINTNLNSCKFDFLPQFNFNFYTNETNPIGSVETTTFNEIPMGSLTENLLTKTMNCYAFDQSGNPIDGEQITSGNQKIAEPTYLDHDRADCLTQLADGAQKKAGVIAALSDEMTNLMNQCDCKTYGNCSPACDPATGCQPTQCPGGTCTGTCIGGACKQSASPDCCPEGVKNQIEHGPINAAIAIGGSGGNSQYCRTQNGYHGLDEFRCPNPIQGDHASCDDIESFVEQQIQVNGKTVTVINQDNWNKLNLIQQLKYFTPKMDEIKSKIQTDETELDKAKTTLSKCSFAISYVDLVKTYEQTNQTQNIILTDPETFNSYDQQTGSATPINISKYCIGFNYDNSSCFKECNDMCPDTGGSYQGCQTSQSQETCIENAYNKRPCPYASQDNNNNAPETFKDCISSCQSDCSSLCAKKYSSGSDEYKFCQSQCSDSKQGNSQCILNNASDCLFDPEAFANCANQTTDQGNTDFCINNAYLCKNGSNEYAGYPDCVNASNGCSINNYSASFLYDNPSCQKCQYADNPPAKGSVCYSSKNATTSCQDLCPETSKCPDASECPYCPCDQIVQTLNFSVPGASVGKYDTLNKNISAHEMVGPQCNGYSYNDDPLTFYCEDNWLNDPNREGLNLTPLGNDYETDIGEEGEIPVGQTVDDAENWANNLINSTNTLESDIQTTITQMTTIGKAIGTNGNYGYPQTIVQDYCKCNAKNESSNPICKTNCDYSEIWVANQTNSGNDNNGNGGGNGEQNGTGENQNGTTGTTGGQAGNTGTGNTGTGNTGTGNTGTTNGNNENNGFVGPDGNYYQYDSATGLYSDQNGDIYDQGNYYQYNGDTGGYDYMGNDYYGGDYYDYNKSPKNATVVLAVAHLNNKISNAEYTNTVNQNHFLLTGSITAPGNGGQYVCACTVSKCKGSPCQQMTDYLSQLWNDIRQLKIDFINFYTTMITEPRSDIMKELTYSRQATNDCSLENTTYGAETRLLSCTRVMNELINPVNSGKIKFNNQTIDGYCYGKYLGSLFNKSLTDNWFCIEKWSNTPIISNNPIYSTQ